MNRHRYQKKGVQFWLDNPRSYFTVDMGMGKTLMALDTLEKIGKPALVIAPLQTIYTTWPEEINKWGLDLSFAIIHGKHKREAFFHPADIHLTNYHSIPFIYDMLYECMQKRITPPFQVLVLDEASKIKSHKTKRYEYLTAVLPLFPKYRLLMSGTPAPKWLLDLWSQYYVLDDGSSLGENYYSYRRKHFIPNEYNPYDFTLKEGSEEKIHKAVQPVTFRLDADDHLDMPELIYNYLRLDLPEKYRKLYNQFKREFVLSLKGLSVKATNSATLSLKLRQFLQGFIYHEDDKGNRLVRNIHNLKVLALKQLLAGINQPVLCAIQFKHEVELIRQLYPDAPVIAGQTSGREARGLIKKWNKKELPLLLCHPASLAHGVNLQAGGCNIIWYCLTWSLEQYLQFNKRLHRQGQRDSVVVNHLVFRHTIDIRVASTLSKKNMTQKAFLDFLKKEKI